MFRFPLLRVLAICLLPLAAACTITTLPMNGETKEANTQLPGSWTGLTPDGARVTFTMADSLGCSWARMTGECEPVLGAGSYVSEPPTDSGTIAARYHPGGRSGYAAAAGVLYLSLTSSVGGAAVSYSVSVPPNLTGFDIYGKQVPVSRFTGAVALVTFTTRFTKDSLTSSVPRGSATFTRVGSGNP